MTASDQDARKTPGREREARDPSSLDAADANSVDFELDIDVDFEVAGGSGEILVLEDDSDDDVFDLSDDAALEAQEVISSDGFRRINESELIDEVIEGEEFDLFEFVDEGSSEVQPPPPPPAARRQPPGVDPRVLGRVNVGPRSAAPAENVAFKDLQRRKQELEGECLALEAQLEHAINKLKSNENRLTETQIALDVSSQALSVSEAHRRSLVEQIAVSMAEGGDGAINRDDMEAWIAELEAEAEAREKEHRARVQNLEGALEAASVDDGALSDREARLASLQIELEASKARAAEAEVSSSARIAALEAEVARLAEAAAADEGDQTADPLTRENESLRFRIQTLEPALEMSRKKNETYRGDVARMKKAVADAQEELQAAKALHEQVEGRLQAVQGAQAQRKDELADLHLDVAQAVQAAEAADAALQIAQAEAAEAEARRAEALARAEAAEGAIEALQAEVGGLKPEVEELRGQLDGLQADRDALAGHKDETISRAIEAERQRDDLLLQASAAEEAHAQVKSALDDALHMRDALQRKSMEAAQERERAVAEELAELKNALAKALDSDAAERERAESLQGALEALRAEHQRALETQETGHKNLAAEHEALWVEHEATQTELERVNSLQTTLEAERDALVEERASLADALEALKTSHEALEARHESLVSSGEADDAARGAIQEARDALAGEVAALKDELQALRERLEASEERHEALERDAAEATSARTALENERGSLLERTRELQDEIAAVKDELVAAQAESLAAAALLAERDPEGERAQAEALAEALAYIADLEGSVERLEIEGDAMQIQLTAAAAGVQRAEALEFALQSVRADVPSFDIDIQMDPSIVSNDPATMVQGIEGLDAEDLALLQGLRDGEREAVRLRSEVDTLRTSCEELDAAREVLQMQRDALEEELDALKQDLGAQASRAADQDAERDRLQGAIQAADVENEELKRSIQAMVSEFEVHQADDGDTQAAHERAEAIEQELARQIEGNQELSRRLDEVTVEVHDLRVQLDARPDAVEFRELQSRLLELESELSNAQEGGAQIEALRAEYQDLAAAYEVKQQSHFERGKQLMSALADAELMRANLVRIAQELSAVREEADNFARHNEQVEARNDELARLVATLEQKVAGISELDQRSRSTIEALEREIESSSGGIAVIERAADLSASSLGIDEGDLDFDQKEANIHQQVDGAYPRGYVLTDDELSVDDHGRAPEGAKTQIGVHADYREKAPEPSTTQFGISIHGDDPKPTVDFGLDDDFDEFEVQGNYFGDSLDGELEDDLGRPPVNVLSADLSLDVDDEAQEQPHGALAANHEHGPALFDADDFDVDDFDADDFGAADFGAADFGEDDFAPKVPAGAPAGFDDEDRARDLFSDDASFVAPAIDDEILEDLEFFDDPLVDRNNAPTIDPFSHLESNNLMDSCPSADFSKAKGVDHRGGFLLAMANGETSIKDIIELSSGVLDSGSAAQLVVEMIGSGAMRL